MMVTRSRYDGNTEWYDEFARGEVFSALRASAVRLLGDGTGLGIRALAQAGWEVVGVDVSDDQLTAARLHVGDTVELLRSDAHALPFADESFDAVVSILTHTDFDDVARVFREVHRVLGPDGVFVYAGVHPCFGSPFVEPLEDGTSLIHPGYRESGWKTVSRDPDRPGIRSRVGINHIALHELLNAALDNGLALTTVDEPGDRDPPLFFAFRATKR
jgi:SAM-dependent methyltransferase